MPYGDTKTMHETRALIREYLKLAKKEFMEEQRVHSAWGQKEAERDWDANRECGVLINFLCSLIFSNDKAMQRFEEEMVSINRRIALLNRKKTKTKINIDYNNPDQ